jgi:hypothetical protein
LLSAAFQKNFYFRGPFNCSSGYLLGSVNIDSLNNKYFYSLASINDSWLYLDQISGNLYCTGIKSEYIQKSYHIVAINAYYKRMNASVGSTVNIRVHIEHYESKAKLNDSKLQIEFSLSELTELESTVWSLPRSVSSRFDSCLIISGNSVNMFYLNNQTGKQNFTRILKLSKNICIYFSIFRRTYSY